ncbi:uncharacterized protein B0H64DRAFT_388629 [Chaetomium fimeti]|uniref:Zn(2)-C6 fungal-type domain-containing protein n=1 Tax=Chaetomium fimeti TaxID=1854472 RepID=A0AAE0HN20_9PEZI|nr:hypothetical protein B0H64DRAFT_388629 [Chaetomium fimeti]
MHGMRAFQENQRDRHWMQRRATPCAELHGGCVETRDVKQLRGEITMSPYTETPSALTCTGNNVLSTIRQSITMPTMFQTESHPPASSPLQSIRSSCDRCRLQKLKCTVQSMESDGRMVCERCIRAKVPCAFGRRRRASRPSDNKKQGDSSSKRSMAPRTNPEPTVLTPPLSTTSSTSDQALGGTTPPPSLASSGMEAPLETLPECEPEAPPTYPYHHLHQSGESPPPPFHHATTGGGMMDWDWLDHDFGGQNDLYCLDPELLATAPPSTSTGSPTAHRSLGDGTVAMGDISMATASFAGRRLPALIAEMQQRLETLENGAWLQDSAQSFDHYPIGAVLRLSQEFGALAGQVLGLAATYGPDAANLQLMAAAGASAGGASLYEPGRGDGGGSASNSTATVLLVLGGYVFLVRLYGLVLGHFHAHLNRIPSGNPGGPTPAASPTLQLGELPSGGAMPDVSRIHAALGMLLAALHSVEEQLGQGGEVAREMVLSILTQGSGLEPVKLQDPLGNLGEQVRSVKELLREKMGL